MVYPACMHVHQHPCGAQGFTRFEAKIGEDNHASLQLFAGVGFVHKRHVAAFKEVTMTLQADAQHVESLRALLKDTVQREAYELGYTG